jgi:tetratricopeptide (TPR) repeat protein
MPSLQDATLRHALLYLRQLVAENDGYLAGGESMLDALAQFDRARPLVKTSGCRSAQTNPDGSKPGTAGGFLQCVPGCGRVCFEFAPATQVPPHLVDGCTQSQSPAAKRSHHAGPSRQPGIDLYGVGPDSNRHRVFSTGLAVAVKIGNLPHQGIWSGNLGNAYAVLGEHEKAIAQHQHHLELATQQGDTRGQGHALANLGVSYAALSRYDDALQAYRKHLDLARQTGDKRDEGHALFSIGEALFDMGDLDQAQKAFSQSLEITSSLQDYSMQSVAMAGLADVLIDQNDPSQAIDLLKKALDLFRKFPDLSIECHLLASLGNAYNSAGLLEDALACHDHLFQLAQSAGNLSMMCHARSNQVSVYRVLGDFAKARELAADCMMLAGRAGLQSFLAFLHWQLGLMFDAEGDYQEALIHMQKTVAYEEQSNSPELEKHRERLREVSQRVE